MTTPFTYIDYIHVISLVGFIMGLVEQCMCYQRLCVLIIIYEDCKADSMKITSYCNQSTIGDDCIGDDCIG